MSVSADPGGRRKTVRVAIPLVLSMGVLLASIAVVLDRRDQPYRAFASDSYWNTPLPSDAPRHARSDEILEGIRDDNTDGFLHLSGLAPDGSWGMPYFWSGTDDPEFQVGNSCDYFRPAEFDRVRIPRGAAPDASDDAHMTVIDRDRGIAYGFYEARYDADAETWSACGGSVWYLDSNGLEATVAGSDCTPAAYPPSGCRGHRGFPHPIHAVRLDEVRAGAIEHVLKIALDGTCGHVWPAAGDEGCQEGTPPEGTRLRVRPDVDLEALGLRGAALVVARALQEYGVLVGDRSGDAANLKVEGCVAEGRGLCWTGLLEEDSLEVLPFTPSLWEVLVPGYGRP